MKSHIDFATALYLNSFLSHIPPINHFPSVSQVSVVSVESLFIMVYDNIYT